jgi:tRNA(adenine34) deaminase
LGCSGGYGMESVFGTEKDLFFMQEALEQAECAVAIDEVPIGAVVVNAHGEIVGRGYNSVERDCTQRAHAECIAIEHASKKLGDWRLNGHWLYVTLEPCSMCMGLIKLSRFNGVVYGASSPLFGFRLDNHEDLWVYKKDAFSIIEGIKEEESAALLKDFFHKKRKKSE